MRRTTDPHSNIGAAHDVGRRNAVHPLRPSPTRNAPDSYTTTIMRSILAAALLVLASCATSGGAARATSDEPRDGRALLARMHDRQLERLPRR